MSILPYQLEPEYYSSEEGEEEQIDSGEEEALLDSSRVESRRTDLSWCECERCGVMLSEVECVRCKELPFLSQLVEGLTCINESFRAVCLNEDVLWTALASLYDRESTGLPDRQQVPNRFTGSTALLFRTPQVNAE
ncbi:hypothetical protein AWC38_SpisGene22064 [Stylophora pistillata]|uniref:Uncharacterized protein n=1 Tax=Stylophora pistillata TaxID=50429 RepID=A0A2B4RBS0_STYPI|nr:hypothetical protein AWC38_SpisGene22064 [Stylophora pistillata]